MIANAITSTPVTDGAAETVFANVKGEPFRGDVSFTATMRMLLHGVMQEGEKFYFLPKRAPYNIDGFRRYDASSWFSDYGVSPDDMEDGTFQFMYTDISASSDKDEFVKVVADKFSEEYCNPEYGPVQWERFQAVTDLFYRNCGVVFFFNREHKSIVMFMDRISMKMYHFMQCAVTKMLPWYFKDGVKLPPEKKALIMAIKDADESEYKAILRRFADQFDFRSYAIKNSLNGFESVYIKQRIRDTQQSITNYDHDIEEKKRQLLGLIREQDSMITSLAGLRARMESGEFKNDVMDYFLANKSLFLESVEGTRLRFSVQTHLDYFNEDVARQVIENGRSYVYTERRGEITAEDMKLLATAAFIDQEVRILMCAAYYLDARIDYDAMSGHSYPEGFEDYIPNPHIEQHSCLGSYKVQISDALRAHNMVQAVDSCVQSAKSVNLNESVSAQYLFRELYEDRKRCIELPDGRRVKPSEAIRWLREQNAPVTVTEIGG